LLYELVGAGAGVCAAKGTLDQCSSGIVALCMLKELGGGEENAFSFGRFQTKSTKVVEDEFHTTLEVFF
jgi:hypothetical protein